MLTFILILLSLTIIAIWLDALCAAINSLSGGYIRSLEEDRTKNAEKWLKEQNEYSINLRALSYVSSIGFTCICYNKILDSQELLFRDQQLQDVKQLGLFLLLIFLFLVLKETLGGIWFSYYRYNLLRFSLPIIDILRLALKPYELLLLHSYNSAHKQDDSAADAQAEVSAENEILSLVEDDEKGELEEDERRMIKGVFDLNDKIAREAMTPRVDVKAVELSISISEAHKAFVSTNFSRLPVYKEKIDAIVGVIFARDFLDTVKVENSNLPKIMHNVHRVEENTPLDELLESFKKTQNHMAIVVDQYGGTSGIITIEDILEEIVGEIMDEFDDAAEEYNVALDDEGNLTSDARASIDLINERLQGPQLAEEEDYDTIGGYIYSEVSRIPLAGERIELKDYFAVILDADERSIISLKLIPKMSEEEA
ncbi:MAG: HlyC/CorC family transporter [Lentisphaeraceae bacterium]|nr:HlyC/CorC family transporter [Lentisphaeraceae bacterium]